jgi:hypothetical protein
MNDNHTELDVDVLTVAYGTSPITAVSSVQPIDDEQGIIYFKSVVAQTTRGNVTAGQSIANATQMEDVPAVGYAGDRLVETVATTTTATTYNYSVTSGPVRPGTISFAFSGDPSSSNYMLIDAVNNAGQSTVSNLLGAGITGTINYATGAVAITFSSAPVAGVIVNITYATDFESATDLPKIVFKLTTKSIHARVFALKDTIGLEQSYALRRRFGLVAEDEVAQDLVSAINSEIMNTTIMNLYANAMGSTTWSQTAPVGVSYFEHKQTLTDYIAKAESVLIGNAGRGTINVLIAGRAASAIIQTLPGFTKISDGSTIGPHIFGTLNGTVIIRVPNSSALDTNTILCIYKGNSPFESAAVYSPFMPLVVTTALPNGLNPLINQKAAAIWAGVDTLVPSFVTKLVVTA